MSGLFQQAEQTSTVNKQRSDLLVLICCILFTHLWRWDILTGANARFQTRDGWKRDSASTESAELATGEKCHLAPIQNRS
jgi:hypothetical protein